MSLSGEHWFCFCRYSDLVYEKADLTEDMIMVTYQNISEH